MGNQDECCFTHLIDGDGTFNVNGVEEFTKQVKLAECGLSYVVVSIMGPQSSGKSTLLNELFRTNFKMMDAKKGRRQTTKGVWMANCAGIEPFTLVMDLEGTDGKEQKDNTAFEKQSALFALAVSDIVLINMWCHDIGREQAFNRPLLKTVFQAMLKLGIGRKTTLMFVIRDKTKTPFEILDLDLREDIQKIWDSVLKPQAHLETPLSEFFNVEVEALNNYEEKVELFLEQVARLRQRFFHSIAPGGLAGDRRAVVPASGFSLSVLRIWKIIKEEKDLDLPATMVMVATVRCEEIANEKFASFSENMDWRKIEEAVKSEPVLGFGREVNELLNRCITEYDEEATFFDEGVRNAKREQLKENLLQLVQPAYHSMLRHIRSGTLNEFKESFVNAFSKGEAFSSAAHNCTKSAMVRFDEGCADTVIELVNWDSDSARIRDKLHRDIDAHIASVQATKLSELTTLYEENLNNALAAPVEALLDGAVGNETWPAIREVLWRETKSAVSELSKALSGFDIDQQTKSKMIESLEDYAKGVVEAKAKEKVGIVLISMKGRFTTLFSHDSDSMPRVWTGKENIRAITKTARSSALKLLSVMAAVRLEDCTDNIETTLTVALTGAGAGAGAGAINNETIMSADPLASSTWEKVPPSKTLLTPIQCKSLWGQFISETNNYVTQAMSAQEANTPNINGSPSPWVVTGQIVAPAAAHVVIEIVKAIL